MAQQSPQHPVVDLVDVARLQLAGRIPLTNWLLYATTWNCTLVALHPITSRFLDLRLSCWIVFVVATWVWYVSPGVAIVAGADPQHDYRLEPGVNTHAVDVLVHVAPLLVVYAAASSTAMRWPQTVATVALFMMYLAVAPTYRLYGEPKDKLLALGLAVAVSYVALVHL